ncbi:MAG: hypothetical protein QM770_01020 [Tepidisphaeraceae bacterium]
MNCRLPIVFASLAALSLTIGCADRKYYTPTELAAEPVASPGAVRRDFGPSTAPYANGDTIHRSTGFRYQPDRGAPSREYIARDTGTYAANLVTLPYTLIDERNDKFVSEGLRIEPTYTATPATPYELREPATRPYSDVIVPATQPVVVVEPTTTPSDTTTPPAVVAPATFSIWGHVSDPGVYQLKQEGSTLTQALAASGLVQKDPTKVTITLSSPDGTSKTFKLDTITGPDTDPVLHAGDKVIVKIVP